MLSGVYPLKRIWEIKIILVVDVLALNKILHTYFKILNIGN